MARTGSHSPRSRWVRRPWRAVLVTALALVGCGGEARPEQSQVVEAFAESVALAHEAQLEWIEIEPTPPIFGYSPRASRTVLHLIDSFRPARLTWAGLDQLGYETQRARRLLVATAEFNDQEEVKETLEEALDAVDPPPSSSSPAERDFLEDWKEMLEAGIEEISYGERVLAYLDAQQDLVEAARHALRTGRLDETQKLRGVLLEARDSSDEALALAGKFFDRRDDLCAELEDEGALGALWKEAQEFCSEARRPELPPPPQDGLPEEPATKPAATKSKPKKPKLKLNAGSKVSTEGIGPILVGMTVPEASKAIGAQLEPIRPSGSSPGCQYFGIPSVKGVEVMVSNGTVARVDVTTPAFSTLSGIRVGDSEDAVTAAYGDRLTAEPLVDHEGANYTYVPNDPADENRLIITVLEGSVFMIRAGRLPEVEYVEGCV